MWARLLRDKKSINKKPHFICNHIAFSKRSARSVPVSCGSARSARTVSTPFSWQAHVIEESVFILVFTLFWPLWQQKLFILITIDRTNHKTRRTRKTSVANYHHEHRKRMLQCPWAPGLGMTCYKRLGWLNKPTRSIRILDTSVRLHLLAHLSIQEKLDVLDGSA